MQPARESKQRFPWPPPPPPCLHLVVLLYEAKPRFYVIYGCPRSCWLLPMRATCPTCPSIQLWELPGNLTSLWVCPWLRALHRLLCRTAIGTRLRDPLAMKTSTTFPCGFAGHIAWTGLNQYMTFLHLLTMEGVFWCLLVACRRAASQQFIHTFLMRRKNERIQRWREVYEIRSRDDHSKALSHHFLSHSS